MWSHPGDCEIRDFLSQSGNHVQLTNFTTDRFQYLLSRNIKIYIFMSSSTRKAINGILVDGLWGLFHHVLTIVSLLLLPPTFRYQCKDEILGRKQTRHVSNLQRASVNLWHLHILLAGNCFHSCPSHLFHANRLPTAKNVFTEAIFPFFLSEISKISFQHKNQSP